MGIPKNCHRFNQDQLISVAACALYRRKNPWGSFTARDVVFQRLQAMEAVQKSLKVLDNGMVYGRDLPHYLKTYGIPVSLSYLYKKIPNFSTHTPYKAEEMLAVVRHLKSLK